MSNSIVSLSSKAMIVSLSISVWSAKKYDKIISGEVAREHGKNDKAGRYNKNLKPEEAEHPAVIAYNRIGTARGHARAEHDKLTLPWTNDGDRILLATAYMDYNSVIRGEQREFDSAVEEFYPLYDQFVELARQSTTVIFREEDYPSLHKLRKKFKFERRLLPFPNQYDFRANLSELELKAARKEVESGVAGAVVTAMRDPYMQLIAAVSRMAETLSDEENNRFHSTLVDNLRELCDRVPKALNLTGDPQLEAFRQEIETGLTQFEAKDLKKDPTLRKTVAERAKEIAGQMEGYIGVNEVAA